MYLEILISAISTEGVNVLSPLLGFYLWNPVQVTFHIAAVFLRPEDHFSQIMHLDGEFIYGKVSTHVKDVALHLFPI